MLPFDSTFCTAKAKQQTSSNASRSLVRLAIFSFAENRMETEWKLNENRVENEWKSSRMGSPTEKADFGNNAANEPARRIEIGELETGGLYVSAGCEMCPAVITFT